MTKDEIRKAAEGYIEKEFEEGNLYFDKTYILDCLISILTQDRARRDSLEPCDGCGGLGYMVHGDQEYDCTACHGTGRRDSLESMLVELGERHGFDKWQWHSWKLVLAHEGFDTPTEAARAALDEIRKSSGPAISKEDRAAIDAFKDELKGKGDA